MEQKQFRIPLLRMIEDTTGVIARYTIPTPNKTHKNAGVTVITAVKRRNAVIIPMIILAAIAKKEQEFLLQQKVANFFTSSYNI
jgi:hypothetical protein